MHTIVREFGIDYIYFDLIFNLIFILLLFKFKKTKPLFAFLFGGIVIFIIDWGFWLNIFHIRQLTLPDGFLPFFSQGPREFIFMLWFSLSYGIMFCWVFIMFEKDSNKILWTVLLFGGWLTIALLSQFLPINDEVINPVRKMSSSRLMQIIIVVIGYIILFIMRYDIKKILYLFLVGCGIHFMMEFSLWISGIRPTGLDTLLANTLIEFNMGIPILYIFWDKVLNRKAKPSTENELEKGGE